MPRQPRLYSGTGIYHVMLRGINHQNIFEDKEDYYQFLSTLDKMRIMYDDEGLPSIINCTYYAFCLMSNHIHLLIREREETIGDTIKRIAGSYAYYYNRKYGRDGHLFKERFKSEPVNDLAYFTILMRYIHQNPMKAGIVTNVSDYEYSSWAEYEGRVNPVIQLCNTQAVLRRIPFEELQAWVNDPLPDDMCFLEENLSEKPSKALTDDVIWQMIARMTGTSNPTDFQRLEKEIQREALRKLRKDGATVRQLQRLTGIGRGLIQRLK
ncbi:MAG: transposase [Bacteroidaceae bacterium]|nr:transposase [Bacteroidaceae bacterium]